MSPDQRWVAAGGADGAIFVWDLQGGGSSGSSGGARLSAERERGGGSSGSSGGQVASPVALRHHKDAVVATAWSHNGATLATADKAGSMAFWCLL